MKTDPIVEELRNARRKLAEKFQFDIKKYLKMQKQNWKPAAEPPRLSDRRPIDFGLIKYETVG